MDSRINCGGYNQSFQGLFSQKVMKEARTCGSCVEVINECTHYAFSDESAEAIKRAIGKKKTVRAYCMNANGFGTQLHRTEINEGPTLSIRECDYNAYKLLCSSPENTAKVEKELIEKGLTNHLNGKIRKFFLRIFEGEE